MTTRSLIGVMGALFTATFAWGQAVPSQIAGIQNGSNGGAHGGNSVQIQYQVDHQGVNQSKEAYMQFDMSVFPSGLTASSIQKATLVLNVNNGGSPGVISICQVAQAWSSSTITGINAPSCTNTPMVTFTVTARSFRQGSFISVDITSLVQTWYEGTGNFGIALVPVVPSAAENDGVNVQFSVLQGNNGYPPLLDLVLQGAAAAARGRRVRYRRAWCGWCAGATGASWSGWSHGCGRMSDGRCWSGWCSGRVRARRVPQVRLVPRARLAPRERRVSTDSRDQLERRARRVLRVDYS